MLPAHNEKTTVLITGANRGLGLQLTHQYLERGWSVIALCRQTSAALEDLKKSNTLVVHCLDLRNDDALSELAEELREQTIDVLLNNAGTMGWTSFADHGIDSGKFGSFDRDEWHEVFDINVCTPMRLSELLVDQVAASENGRIVTISSMVGSMALNTIGSMYAYRASKAAVNAIMKSMAIDLAPRGIIAAAVHPGFVRTEMGGPMADIEPEESVMGMIKVIDELKAEQAGTVVAWNGETLPW